MQAADLGRDEQALASTRAHERVHVGLPAYSPHVAAWAAWRANSDGLKYFS